jgi:uncharacterized membrane protein
MWIFAVAFGAYVWLPFIAPVFMYAGLTLPGIIIQKIYSTQCHQLPDRSFFLFGPQATYSIQQVQAAWQNTLDPAVLRQFIGNPQMGWKVAWSDRMVAMYTSTWVFALLWWPFRKYIRPLPLWGLILFWLPMAADGGTHFISDLLGSIAAGFRYDNTWLASLTGHALPAWFYSGNALGSFNSDMRLLTGFLFGIGLVWFAFPILNEVFQDAAHPRPPVMVPLQPYQLQSQYPHPAVPQNTPPIPHQSPKETKTT